MTAMTALHFLSPDSICHSFDEKANGYSRGEGASFVVLKPLDQALKDHDVIRGVIRNTAVNQDGNTPGITVPSATSQEAMIRKCYADAGLSLSETQYVEAHGTGTQAGDPQETSALSATLGLSRPANDPLLIGSIKTNIGHLEGASGLAQVTKAIFSLEKAELAPNLWYEKPNARIPMDDWNLKVVDKLTPWPTAGPRRISINSFGYGGTNAHCILDDAYHYLKARGLQGNHNTVALYGLSSPASPADSGVDLSPPISLKALDHFASSTTPSPTKLFVWSSNEQSGVERMATMYREYLAGKIDSLDGKQEEQLFAKFARTLSSRRSIFPWKSFGVASSTKELCGALESPVVKPKRSAKAPKLGFIFTGQGAQWYAMGRELCAHSVFQQSLEDASAYLVSIGSSWSLLGEFLKDEASSSINKPSLSQPICTALQVALVDLLKHWGVKPHAVAGHSSGEIAAAYAKGSISREAAWSISFHRGRLSENIRGFAPNISGAMLATGLGSEAIKKYLDRVTKGTATVACKNSPSSTTISGDSTAIKQLEVMLKEDGQFARRLLVETAYHSFHMHVIADLYLNSISNIQTLPDNGEGVKMFSSVTGQLIESAELGPSYWIKNMVNQVEFQGAVQSLCQHSDRKGRRSNKNPFVDILMELGPHSALQGPLKQILKAQDGKIAEITCMSVLQRGKDACGTALDTLGRLFQNGYPVNVTAANNSQTSLGKDGYLVDIPPFAWNRDNKYWCESQVSKNYRFRKHPRTDLLGAIIPQANTVEPLFRNVMKLAEIPWVEDHKVQGTILYPAAGMLVMAIQAAERQIDPTRDVEGYELRDVLVGKAIVIPTDDSGTETMLSLRPWRAGSQDLFSAWDEFRMFSRQGDSETWELNCTGLIRPKYKAEHNAIFTNEDDAKNRDLRARFDEVESGCTKTLSVEQHYEQLATIGLNFSGPFKSLVEVKKGHYKSRCEIRIPDTKSMMPHEYEFPHVIHPSTLDSIIQMGLSGATAMDQDLNVALVPTFVEELFVSTDVPTKAGAMLHGCAVVNNEGFEDAHGDFIVFDDQWKKPLVSFHGVKSTAVRHGELGFAQAAQMRKLAAYFHWQEDIEKLDRVSLEAICSEPVKELEQVQSRLVSDLEHASFCIMKRVIKSCTPEEAQHFAPHFHKFYNLMQKTFHEVVEGTIPHQDPGATWLATTERDENSLLERVAKASPDGAVLVRHGEKLVEIMRGEVLAIEVLMENNLLNNFYQFGLGCPQIYAQLSAYVDLLAHKNPDMKILEIGAGTGGATLSILQALGGHDGSSPRFSNYTFTDISTGFFEKAHEKFKSWLPYMNFSKLDIEEDPTTQGLKAGDYDLVIAYNVLHATLSMDVTLSNVKKLLKPEGKLILNEITNPLLRIHMIVGSFDGWWVGGNDGREWGPTMSEETWNEVLLRNSFSGVDIALRDNENPKDQFYSLMVSTASKPQVEAAPKDVLLIEPQLVGDELRSFTTQFTTQLETRGAMVSIVKLQDTVDLDVATKSCVFTVDCESTNLLLPEIDQHDWKLLQRLIMTANNSMWVTQGATINSESPTSNLMTGMARCIRAENPSVALVTLDMDFNRPIASADNIETVIQVYLSGVSQMNSARPDWEFAIRDNKILIQRILLEKNMNDLISSFHMTPKAEVAPFEQPGRPLELQIGTPGRLDTFRFGDDASHDATLGDEDVEIKVKSVGLNFKDVMIAMGQLQELALGLDCSGVVTRVGAGVTNFKAGDRVMTWTVGSFRTYARSPASMCYPIPEGMEFGTAASLPLIYSTAYYALFEVARVKKGETVLIHGAAGGVGQAAIVLAKHLGAEIFATVSSEAKKSLIMENYNIPEDHIFNSRDDSFVNGVMRMTNKRGVNVILNSLAGEGLRKSWQCISWFGRFIEMGQKDIESNTGLDMAPFIRNVSYHSINLIGLLRHDLPTCSKVFKDVMALFDQNIAKPVSPTTTMPFSQIEEGFRLMQNGKHIGKIVLEAHDNDLVPLIPAKVKATRFDPEVTYLLSGGLGGLGRSLSQWMVRQGAKNIVFLSRSGAAKAEAKLTLETLTKAGAKVAAYSCDVSNAETVQAVLKQCAAEFPPIKGCIQGAMVLQDAMYENMTHEQYMAAVRPKVQGSWNLHNHLPKDMDFFVLLSSSAGVAGSRGQGNYAAGMC